MKYPYIGQQYSSIILFYAENKGLVVDDALGLDESTEAGDKIELPDGVNITHEYLSNTWGVVESKEHAEFIIELAELHGIRIFHNYRECKSCIFIVYGNEMKFHCDNIKGSISVMDIKKITIPLPPKAKEWPQVGDEVASIHSGNIVTVVARCKGQVCAKWRGGLIILDNKDIEKPKRK